MLEFVIKLGNSNYMNTSGGETELSRLKFELCKEINFLPNFFFNINLTF